MSRRAFGRLLLKIQVALVLVVGVTTLLLRSASAQGWYLLQPPVVQGPPARATPDALRPLSEWRHVMAFASADECDLLRLEATKRAASDLAEAKRDYERVSQDRDTIWRVRIDALHRWNLANREFLLWDESRCIVSNDPRLR